MRDWTLGRIVRRACYCNDSQQRPPRYRVEVRMSQQLVALAGLGFLLGMRHATDADHVIAVTTILARSRRFLHSTVIGALWGFGHTVTVLVVGVAIIAFNVVIPPPIGLAMELAVAVMLDAGDPEPDR